MDESNLFSSQSRLPPKRKFTYGEDNAFEKAADTSQSKTNENEAERVNVVRLEDELDPELLAELEQTLKPIDSDLAVEIPGAFNKTAVSAPILEDYIDPHTVPIKYLLQQARAALRPEDLEEMNEMDKNENQR